MNRRIYSILPYIIVSICGLAYVGFECFGEPFNFSAEDGVLEWATVVSFLACCTTAVVALCTRWRTLNTARKRFLIIFALVTFLAAGEELSWGQRFFHIEVPESLTAGSVFLGYKDLSLHNIRYESEFIRFSVASSLFGTVLLLGLLIHGIWLPKAIAKGKPSAKKFVSLTGAFVPALHVGVLLFVSAFIFHYLKKIAVHTEPREYKEFLVPCVYFFMMLNAYFGRLHPKASDN